MLAGCRGQLGLVDMDQQMFLEQPVRTLDSGSGHINMIKLNIHGSWHEMPFSVPT